MQIAKWFVIALIALSMPSASAVAEEGLPNRAQDTVIFKQLVQALSEEQYCREVSTAFQETHIRVNIQKEDVHDVFDSMYLRYPSLSGYDFHNIENAIADWNFFR